MAEGKWIDDLSGELPLATAAQHILRIRLGAVGDRLPAAVFHAEEDVEHVHQLRVSTRRAAAAVRIFRDLLTDRAQKGAKKTLRKIRRAAGAARDWDVFLEMVAGRLARPDKLQAAGLDFLLGYGQGQRAVSQLQLLHLQKLADRDYPSLVNTVLESLDSDFARGTFRSQAVPLLTSLLGELDAAAAEDLHDYEKLHRVRILGKQLRYAMEVFAGCFNDDFREKIYPAIEEMQSLLGGANDSFTAARRLTDLRARLEKAQPSAWPRYQKGIEALTRYHQRRLPDLRRRFLRWWQEWQASGMEHRLEKMLRD